MLAALVSGLLLGLSCGLAPGPLLALVLAQSLRYGPREGCKVALAPLFSDAPIILLALTLAAGVAKHQEVLGLLCLAGGVVVLFLAVDTFRPARELKELPEECPRSWLKGFVVNFLNPHPWLFWMTVGAALLAQARKEGWLAAAAFLIPFYLLLIGSKLLLALVVGRSRQFLAGPWYRLTMGLLGALLAIFAVLLMWEGVKHLIMV